MNKKESVDYKSLPFFNARPERFKRKPENMFREEVELKKIFDNEFVPERWRGALKLWNSEKNILDIYLKYGKIDVAGEAYKIIDFINSGLKEGFTFSPHESTGKPLVFGNSSIIHFEPGYEPPHDLNLEEDIEDRYNLESFKKKHSNRTFIFQEEVDSRTKSHFSPPYGLHEYMPLGEPVKLFYNFSENYAVKIGEVNCQGLDGLLSQRDALLFRCKGHKRIQNWPEFAAKDKQEEYLEHLKKWTAQYTLTDETKKVIEAVESVKGDLIHTWSFGGCELSSAEYDELVSIYAISHFGNEYKLFEAYSKNSALR